LIDEADVLVAKRSEKELERNAIIASQCKSLSASSLLNTYWSFSVFLNLVEYYKGLLFVTTNREYTFDEAFKNRMHAIVRFPELGYNSRLNIWRNFLFNSRRPIPLDESLSKDETEIQILAKLKCNGRDIRNLIRTAFSYASSYNQKLGVRHIAVVMKELSQEKNVEELLKDLAPAIKRVRTGLIDDQDPTMPKDSNAGGSKV
jgi:SpoVK/Ycf46/Vps4 family AAA+-type ATPase